MDQTVPHPELYGVPYMTTEFNGMPYRRLGRSGLWVSTVGLGTWKIGYPETGDGSRVNERTAWEMFDRAIALGVTFWDTANRYNEASGNSERVIGRWFKANPDQRRNVVLATKIAGGMDGRTPNHSHLSRQNILDSVQACLDRLQTDHLDVLYFHVPDPNTPLEESLATIADLVARDRIRYFAVSNVNQAQLAAGQRLERQFTVRCRVLAVQNRFDVVRGEAPEASGVLARCARTGASFVAYSPLARGLLTERYLDPAHIGKGDRLFDEKATDLYQDEALMRKVRSLAALAREWGLSLSQLALAYMLTLPGMGPVIPSASSVAQLEANAAVAKVKLSADQRARIKAALNG